MGFAVLTVSVKHAAFAAGWQGILSIGSAKPDRKHGAAAPLAGSVMASKLSAAIAFFPLPGTDQDSDLFRLELSSTVAFLRDNVPAGPPSLLRRVLLFQTLPVPASRR